MNKKEKEKYILNMIFSSKGIEILETEEPDFIITDNNKKLVFGVEITEFFVDDCYARLQNIPSYFSDVINKGKYYKKGDNKKLPAEKVKIINKDVSESEEISAIITDVPSRDNYSKKLIQRIEDKNSKINNYRKKTDTHYLIIFDNQNCLSPRTTSDLYETIFTLDLSKAIINSDFKEIFFITRIKDKFIFYRLKQVNFIALCYLSLDFAKSKTKDKIDAFGLFITILNYLNINFTIGFCEKEQNIEITYDIYNVILKEIDEQLDITNSTSIFNYTIKTQNIISPQEYYIKYFDSIKDEYIEFLKTKVIKFDVSSKVLNDLNFNK